MGGGEGTTSGASIFSVSDSRNKFTRSKLGNNKKVRKD